MSRFRSYALRQIIRVEECPTETLGEHVLLISTDPAQELQKPSSENTHDKPREK